MEGKNEGLLVAQMQVPVEGSILDGYMDVEMKPKNMVELRIVGEEMKMALLDVMESVEEIDVNDSLILFKLLQELMEMRMVEMIFWKRLYLLEDFVDFARFEEDLG